MEDRAEGPADYLFAVPVVPGGMMRAAYDQRTAALVAEVTGKVTDQELRAFGRAILRLDGDALKADLVPATILTVVMSGDRPSAEQRRIMADIWTPTQAPLHLFALVSTSPVARGIFRVVQWLNPPGGRRREGIHATFADATRWMEEERGARIPSFGSLNEEVTGGPPAAMEGRP